MKKPIVGLAVTALLVVGLFTTGSPARAQSAKPRVVLETSKGRIVVELDDAKAPLTVANFLGYVDSEFYDGTLFHRVIETFMIQGGGFTADMVKKPTEEAIVNEAKNGLKNDRGTIAMARTGNPHSATAQFFINTVDNDSLNDPGGSGWGYAVFGKVVEGQETVDAIAAVATGVSNGMGDVPQEPVVIESARRIE